MTESLASISHISSGSYLQIQESGSGYEYRQQVTDRRAERQWVDNLESLNQVVNSWARLVVEDIDQPDLWADFQRGTSLIAEPEYFTVGNEPFSPNEQLQISAQLREIKEYIVTTHEHTSEELSNLEARLDQVEAASRHMGRKDWLMVFLGVLFTLIASGIVSPAEVQLIIGMTASHFGHLFGIGGGGVLAGPSDG